MKKSKKAVFYSITILIFTIFILIVALIAVFNKAKQEKKLGEEQMQLIQKYQEGEKALFYIDQASKYSVYKAIYLFAEKGAYSNEPICGNILDNSKRYIMWQNTLPNPETKEYEDVECYPSKGGLTYNFAAFLNQELNKYFEIYPSAKIPKDNYDLQFEEKGQKTDILAIATADIIISSEGKDKKPDSIYTIKPSFRTELNYKLINQFTEYVNNSKNITQSMKSCLSEGSKQPDDDDLETCSNPSNFNKIKNIDNYGITPITSDKDYTILFDIDDSSLKNPYSTNKLNVRFGIKFLDKFAPPSTEIIKELEEKEEDGNKVNYLTWKVNNASDVKTYEIYYLKIEKGLNREEIPDSPPSELRKMDNLNNPFKADKTELKLELEQGDYYFYIRAVDQAGNFVKDIDRKPIKITI